MQISPTKLRLSKIVPLGFSSIIGLLVINGFLSKLMVGGLSATTGEVMHSYQVQTSLQQLEKVLVDVQLGERGFIITQNEDFLTPYNQAKSQLDRQFNEARVLLKGNVEQIKRLDELEVLAKNGIAVLSQNISKVRAGQAPSEESLLNGKQQLELLRTKIDEMLEAENIRLAAKQKSAKEAEVLSTLISLGGTLLGTAVGSLIILFVVRQVVKPINEVTQMITTSSSEIAATVEQQERITAEQAASVNQTTTTIEELGASSRQAAGQAEEAATGARHAMNLAEGGTQTVVLTLEGMQMLQEKVNAVADSILLLNQQTGQIGDISGLVRDLANQTNLLALNAAVEAVRAGEYGKGFGVVATEIRKLADQSKKAAEKINTLVAEIQMAIASTVRATDEGTRTVEDGVKLAHQTADAFRGVATAIDQIFVNNQQISLSAKQQANAIQQVADAMNILNHGAVETASGMTQTRSGTQKLNEAASTLKAVV